MTKEISGVDIDVLRTCSSRNTAHFSSWIIKNYNIPERFKGFSLEMAASIEMIYICNNLGLFIC